MFPPVSLGFNKTIDYLQYLHNQYILQNKNENSIPMFLMKYRLGTTCINELGCLNEKNKNKNKKNNYFDTFLSRHKCLCVDRYDFSDPKKYICDPSKVWYGFVHAIPKWKDGVKNTNALYLENITALHLKDHWIPLKKYQQIEKTNKNQSVEIINKPLINNDIQTIYPLFQKHLQTQFCGKFNEKCKQSLILPYLSLNQSAFC